MPDRQPNRQSDSQPAQQILPPLSPEAQRAPLAAADVPVAIDPDMLPPELEFDAVPRAAKRWNGISMIKQRHFIAQLAASGSVSMAAKSIGVSTSALYILRKADGAESFAAAWEKAVEMGARQVLDMLMDHAIHGTPETLLQGGNVILERRKYNTRAMMWIVQQRFPEQYGGSLNVMGAAGSSMPHSIRKLKDQWRKEWEEEMKRSRPTREKTDKELMKKLKALGIRTRHEQAMPFIDDPEKRAAYDLLYGPTDWAIVRRYQHNRADTMRRLTKREVREGEG